MYKPQLKTFITVCETGSFSSAAQQLYITPSAVIQQINALEADLGVTLFHRSRHGITLTEPGEYLQHQAADYIRKGEDIRRELLMVASSRHRICIGTSLFEKCRLLYSLWVLFSQQEREYEIQMVNIVLGQPIPAKTDLIESVNSGIAWMKDWDFLKICDVPFAFAVPTDHPLAKKEMLSLEDLAGENVLSLDGGSTEMIQSMLDRLREGGANVLNPSMQGASIIWETSFKKHILLVPACWEDILLNMKMVCCSWDYQVPYGIFYRRKPSSDTQHFLEFVRRTYADGNDAGVVPVL